ncbi:MAG: hypothetical protein DRH37_09135 [Deltaproteobacteria bacterium]|nr:MAG: hypothetical protein DRH37_09135 [Deltaproteobacteria bacterium]
MRNSLILLLFLSFLLISCGGEETPPTDTDNDSGEVSDIDPGEIVTIPDENLRKCVLANMSWKEEGEPIYAEDAAKIKVFGCNEVANLTGLKYFIALEDIEFRESTIKTLEPLSHITNIEYVDIRGGSFTDLSSFNNHTNLKNIKLIDVPIGNLDVLFDKERITHVFIGNTKIITLQPILNLLELETLIIRDNPLLTTLGGQFNTPKLDNITLDNNALESLDGLSGLPELTSISANDNMLTDVDFITTLPKLRSFGITGNCLDADALEVYIEWINNEYPDEDITVEDKLKYQNPSGKCGW